MKRLLLALALCLPAALCAFMPPEDKKDGLVARFAGLDEDRSGDRLKPAEISVRGTSIKLEISNGGPVRVTGNLTFSMPDDWIVEGPKTESVAIEPGGTKIVERKVAGTERALKAIYPIHARFTAASGVELHPIALVYAADGARAAATPARVAPGRIGGNPPPASAAEPEVFPLDVRGERMSATVELGSSGVFDGKIVFSDGTRSVTLSGFLCDVDGFPVGAGEKSVCVEKVEVSKKNGRLEVLHRLAAGERTPAPVLRATFSADRCALRLAWDMPGAARSAAGTPRYTRLMPGGASSRVARGYASHGNVLSDPGKFRLRANGFALSTRHVGADYDNGLSLLQATDVVPDFWVSDPSSNLCGLEAHHDATFVFVPSARGAFAAARAFADVCGYAKSPGFDRLSGRLCLDQWGGDYGEAAEGLRMAAKYGLGNAVFVKHDWQRWGYDFRLPDVYPPSGDMGGFLEMRRAAKEAGILFVVHDNFTDFYPDAEGFTFDAVRFDDAGLPIKAWYHPGRRAQSYGWLPNAIHPWVERNGRLLGKGFHPDGIFIDVLTAEAPFDYRDRAGRFHPKGDTADAWRRAFSVYRAAIGRRDGVMISETGTDALVGAVDAAEADHPGADRWFGDGAFSDWERVPWHDMVTHGRMILQAGGLGWRYAADRKGESSARTASHGYASDDYLGMTLLGGRQPMSDGPFGRHAVETEWMIGFVSRTLAGATLESVEFVDGNIHHIHSVFSGGCEVWQNRSSEGEWIVGAHRLPPWGFVARAPKAFACSLLRGGRAVRMSRSDGRYFVDSRPKHRDGRAKAAGIRAKSAKATGPRDLEVAVDWRLSQPIKRGYTFVHVVPEDGGEQPIVTQASSGVSAEQLAVGGRFSSTVKLRLPDNMQPGRYDLRAGVCGDSGSRLAADGVPDGQMRIKIGTVSVAKNGDVFSEVSWNPPRESAVDASGGAMADFGKISTNGAFLLERKTARQWRLTPLPGSYPFRASIALSLLGAAHPRKADVVPVDPQLGARSPEAEISGDRLELSLDADAFAYDILLK